MVKYRGKYKKCRSCIHAIEPMMVFVMVKSTCPKAHRYIGGFMSDKSTCEECEFYKEAAANGKSNITDS